MSNDCVAKLQKIMSKKIQELNSKQHNVVRSFIIHQIQGKVRTATFR